MLIICKNNECGEEFNRPPSVVARGRGLFCSRECFNSWGSKNLIKDKGRNWRGGKITLICKQCHLKFYVYPYAFKQFFCNNKCRGRWLSENKKGENHPSWGGGEVEKKCKHCGEVFLIHPAHVKNGEGVFCDRKCHGEWQSENYLGENNPCWRGGIKPFSDNIRRTSLYYRWRRAVIKRDGGGCSRCPQVGGILHVHHLVSFSKIVKNFRDKYPLIAVDYISEMWDISNGITLCESCHIKEHKKL